MVTAVMSAAEKCGGTIEGQIIKDAIADHLPGTDAASVGK